MNSVLMKAILSMDSYNRGYGAGIVFGSDPNNSIETAGTKIGNATIVANSGIFRANGTRADDDIGFYAIAYDTNNDGKGDIISYRGTDKLVDIPSVGTSIGGDIWNAYLGGAGSAYTKQSEMAVDFYKTVVGACPFNNDRDTYSC